MKRLILLLSVIVFGVAAPARAWCEATCVQPTAGAHERAEAPQPHCPGHSQAPGTHVSNTSQDQCPQTDVARQAVPARPFSPESWKAALLTAIALPHFAPRTPHHALRATHSAPRTAQPALLPATPLRI